MAVAAGVPARAGCLVWWFALGGAVGGCVTSADGKRMNAETARLGDRIKAMERRDAEINEQVVRLRTVLDQATALLSRNSADVGAKVAKTETDIAMLAGQIEEAKHLLAQLQERIEVDSTRIAALEQGQQKIVERVAPSIPADKETLWKETQGRLGSGMREDARRFLRAFVQRFPQDVRAAQAQILIGQSFAVEGRHSNAISEYQKVLASYAKSPEVAEAMWLIAQSFVEMKFCSDAKAFLQDLAKRYPKARTDDVKQKLRELQKLAKDKRYCAG